MSTALHITAACLVLAGLAWACQWVYRQSRPAGVMFAAGLAIRAVGALFFFFVSFLHLPLMTRLQMGDGFWLLAPDAQEYYRQASLAAESWRFGPVAAISPGYVGSLALFMRAVGVNSASPELFSLALYAVSVVAVVAAFRRTRTRASQQAVAVGVAALSFSPILIFSAMFGLKDVFVTTLIVLLAIAYVPLFAEVWTRATLRANLLAAAVVLGSMWLISATRSYFAILTWTAAAMAHLGRVIAGQAARLRHLIHAAVVLTSLGVVIVVGSESNYPDYLAAIVVARLPAGLVDQAPASWAIPRLDVPEDEWALRELERRRDAIIAYGGDSVLNDRRSAAPDDRLRALAIGVGAVFVPLSILERLSIVDIPIRITARLVADADTLVFDLTIVAVLWVLMVNRRLINPWPLVFALALAVLVALPLGYVMTNYGTLVRLRLMVAAPIWLMLLALASRPQTR